MKCPQCHSPQWALYACDDGKHRCWSCKTAPKAQSATPEPAATTPTQTEHALILQAKVHIRNRLARLEGLSGWDRSPWNCGKHEGLREALEILKGGYK